MTYASEVIADAPLNWWRGLESPSPILANHGSLALPMVASSGQSFTGLTGVTADGGCLWTGGAFDCNVGGTLTTSRPGSHEVWVYIPAHSANLKQIFAWDGASVGATDIFLPNSDIIHVALPVGVTQLVDTTSFPYGTWVHIVVTNDGTNGRLYVNGTLRSTVGGQSVGSATLAPYLGGFQEVVGNNIIGMWTEAAYYGSALSAARILAHFNAAELKGAVPVPRVAGIPSTPADPPVSIGDALALILRSVRKVY